VLALLGGSSVCQNAATPGAKRQAREGEEMQRVTVDLSALLSRQTVMGVQLHKSAALAQRQSPGVDFKDQRGFGAATG